GAHRQCSCPILFLDLQLASPHHNSRASHCFFPRPATTQPTSTSLSLVQHGGWMLLGRRRGPRDIGASCRSPCPHDHGSDDSHGHGHDHGYDHEHGSCGGHAESESLAPCDQAGECCDDAQGCCDSSASTKSATLTCCDSNEEHCDEKCIIAAAALECEKTCESDVAGHDAHASHDHAHDQNGQHPASACSTHLAKAFDQYAAYLESARCICRSILERGWSTTCCAEQPKQTPKAAPVEVVAHAHATGQGAHTHDGPHHHHGIKRRGKKARHQHAVLATKEEQDGGCCSGHQVEHGHQSDKDAALRPANTDLERAEGLEHVALTVDGMTCSGCGNKMERTLKALPGVSSVRVNFVMGSAEFSLDTDVTTPDEVIRATERATGFRCTRLSNDDQTVDLLASGALPKCSPTLPSQELPKPPS
ncbi:hypothetical protein ACCO45_009580, partial [Purpureocillium lilacinum]